MSARREITPQYIYATIPAEYVCVYHRILAMLSDYGEDMLKDCKAACTDRNSGVIECFNMFNAAVAAKMLGEEKKATLIINYIKAKINQIYKGKDNSPSFVFPIDENGALKAFVSCNDRPRFWIDDDDLFEQAQDLGKRDLYSISDENNGKGGFHVPFDFTCEAHYENNRIIVSNLTFYYNGADLPESEYSNITTEFYVNGIFVPDLAQYEVNAEITTNLRVVSYYKGGTNNHTYAIEVI